jgi:hypothetical protein
MDRNSLDLQLERTEMLCLIVTSAEMCLSGDIHRVAGYVEILLNYEAPKE